MAHPLAVGFVLSIFLINQVSPFPQFTREAYSEEDDNDDVYDDLEAFNKFLKNKMKAAKKSPKEKPPPKEAILQYQMKIPLPEMKLASALTSATPPENEIDQFKQGFFQGEENKHNATDFQSFVLKIPHKFNTITGEKAGVITINVPIPSSMLKQNVLQTNPQELQSNPQMEEKDVQNIESAISEALKLAHEQMKAKNPSHSATTQAPVQNNPPAPARGAPVNPNNHPLVMLGTMVMSSLRNEKIPEQLAESLVKFVQTIECTTFDLDFCKTL